MADTVSIDFVRARKGDGYVLSRTTTSGRKTNIPLSPDQVLGLGETIAIFRAQILSQYRSESGGVEPIYVLHAPRVRVQPDALGANVLLTFVAPTEHQTTHSLPPHVAQYIAGEIPAVLDQMSRPTRQ